MQLRQYNSLGWPYCGVSMKDEDFNVCVGSESVIIEESNEGYEWILKAMADIERNFIISNIRLMFADKKNNSNAPSKLGYIIFLYSQR